MSDIGELSETGFYIFFRREEEMYVRGPITLEKCLEVIAKKYRKSSYGRSYNVSDIVKFYNYMFSKIELMGENNYRIAYFLTQKYDTNYQAEIIYFENPTEPNPY